MKIPLFEKKEIPRHFLFKHWPTVPSIDDLAKGRVGNAESFMAKRLRRDHGLGTGGWTKKRTMRAAGAIPFWVLKHHELGKYFNSDMRKEDRKKEQMRFLQKYPQFKTVDRL